MNEALPVVIVCINGCQRMALLDIGCSRSLVTRALCHSWNKKKVDVFTVGEGALRCCGVGRVQLDVGSGCPIDVEVLVADRKLLGFDLLLGFDIIKKLGGVYMTRDEMVSFPQLDRPVCTAIAIDKPDFHAEFDQNKKIWVVSENQTPLKLENKATEYLVAKQLRAEFDNELPTWIDNGWVIPYPEEYGPPKGLIPLMAVLQANKQKIFPVMDYQVLNKHVDAHTANADVCVQKLREWRQKESNVAVLDLRQAYLQVHIDKSLWPFQTAKIKGQRYCLTRLGFGLNVAPL